MSKIAGESLRLETNLDNEERMREEAKTDMNLRIEQNFSRTNLSSKKSFWQFPRLKVKRGKVLKMHFVMIFLPQLQQRPQTITKSI